MFSVALKLEGRPCLVVGGGGVALRKILSLVDAGACVTVVAPRVVDEIEALAAAGRVRLEKREYRAGEADAPYVLVFATTDRRDVNRAVYEDATAAGLFANVADDPELCSFHLPARVRRGPLEISIASGGGAPFLVRRLRQAFEAKLGPAWAEWAQAAARFRAAAKAGRAPRLADSGCARSGQAGGEGGADREFEQACFDRFVAETLDAKELKIRVPSKEEMDCWINDVRLRDVRNATKISAALQRGQASSATTSGPSLAGFVSLVGAGPGCAGLLTVKGLEQLRAADAIVYDRLAAGALPTDLPDSIEFRGVGKEAGHHPVPQEQINELLLRLAGEGKRVVRLKGGDPYVFGRGGEEAEALEAAGVPFEVIPGVTAAVAATAFAGIPVTHRREAVQMTLLTAHECSPLRGRQAGQVGQVGQVGPFDSRDDRLAQDKQVGSKVRWDLLAQQRDATLVGYMGLAALGNAVEKLLAAGMDTTTPAAMVEQGATSAQRSVVATLETLCAEVMRQKLQPPALFVIGPTVGHAKRLNWAEKQPLFGERLAVPADAREWCSTLENAGAEVVSVPMPMTTAARIVLGVRPLTGCIVRSPAEVEAFDEECAAGCRDARWTAWCADEAAAMRARERGWRRIRTVSELRIVLSS